MIVAPSFAVSRRISSAVAASDVSSRPLTTTTHPASARERAQALPMPRLEAQTTAYRPSIPSFLPGTVGQAAA